MFFASLKAVSRTLRNHPVYSLISLIGLAAGMATFIVIILFVAEQLRYDRFHEQADRIFRVTSTYSDAAGTRSFARSYPAIGPALRRDFPEVEAAVRIQRWNGSVRYEDKLLNEQDMFFVDPSFLEVFTFPVERGAASGLLRNPGDVVLTATTARRYFGDEDPIGRVITVSDTVHLTVSAVLSDLPAESHMHFTMLMPMELLRDRWAERGNDLEATWTSGTFYTYVLLSTSGVELAVGNRLADFVGRYVDQDGDGTKYSLGLQPLTSIHLKSDLRQEMESNGSERNVFIFITIAALVLLISCVNFVNLATARAAKRAAEVGVRKALGAGRGQLIRHFLVESITLSVVSLLLALIVVDRVLPWFNDFAGSSISLWSGAMITEVLLLGALACIVGLLAGAYPSLLLSSAKPAAVLGGGRSSGGRSMKPGLRRGLVGFQFFLSVAIIASTFVVRQQTEYMQTSDLGFDTSTLVLPYYWDGSVTSHLTTLKQELLKLPKVSHVTASGDVPGRMFTSMSYWIEGMDADEVGGINALIVDEDFAETYGLKFVAGRDFSLDLGANLGESFILNESTVRELGRTPEGVIGKSFEMNTRGPVIGVVKDFHFEGLQTRIEPLAMTVWPSWFGYVSIDIDDRPSDRLLADIEAVWQSVNPRRPFEYFFLDQDFEQQYRSEQRFGEVFAVFALLAILISCLGLLGLAAFTAEQKTKEIGIRKTFGASVSQLVALINREFALTILVGGLTAVPITWIIMKSWLAGFAYRVDASAGPYVVALAGALVIAVMTVSYHSIRAATANPIESLRYE